MDNATFRLLAVVPAWTCYLVPDFRASAVSDFKRGFITRIGVNPATGTLPDAVIMGLGPFLDRLEPDTVVQADLPPLWDRDRVEVIRKALPPRLHVALDPFIEALRRRLARDPVGCIAITTICIMRRWA